MEEPDSFIGKLLWLNPKNHRPQLNGDYMILARGEKDRVYPMLVTWNGLVFVDDFGIDYRRNDYIAFCEVSNLDRPPFDIPPPEKRMLWRRYSKKRKYDEM